MGLLLQFFTLATLCLQCSCSHWGSNNEILTIPELIKSYGYPAEIHTVKTSDNYIISMHRIPHGKNNISIRKKPIVFLQHGFLASSDAWVLSGPDNGLAFLLADSGYDVWLGNSRGNTYSIGHKTFKPISKNYWDFTMHEMGVYDLPANIDYILKETGNLNLYYVGHSQGCATFFILTSMFPKYNTKVKAFFGLAPGVYVGNMGIPLVNILAPMYKQDKAKILEWLMRRLDLLPHSNILSYVLGELCKDGSSTQAICTMTYLETAGYAPDQLNKTFLPTLFKYFPAGTSFLQGFMYLQLKNTGMFTRFDYGEIGNLHRYKTSKPPSYNISLVTVPVHLYHGGKDLAVVPEDAIKLAQEVSNLRERIEINEINFAHNDFAYGVDAKEYVYKRIINTLDDYERTN